jgi:hypothetical protein
MVIILATLLLVLNELNAKRIDKNHINVSLERLETRLGLAKVLTRLRLHTMIEVGVHKGQYADQLLSRWPTFTHYYGVDVWRRQTNYVDSTNLSDDDQALVYVKTFNYLTSKFGANRVTLIRSLSTEALGHFANGSIDFIYIDARHDYCGCSEDLVNYYGKLRCGGLFAGHDYQYDSMQVDNDWSVCANGSRIVGSVKQAVLDFAKRNSIRKVFSTRESAFSSWYFVKPC